MRISDSEANSLLSYGALFLMMAANVLVVWMVAVKCKDNVHACPFTFPSAAPPLSRNRFDSRTFCIRKKSQTSNNHFDGLVFRLHEYWRNQEIC